ncbi:hypothetical protein N7G274_005877 [Stereocaulon virgatum]|uniref:Uncharacterized protein n=1 Tax=Stereocaulon virgatum TaxID=373712 RepID=A0ABR4A6Q2_9LECA
MPTTLLLPVPLPVDEVRIGSFLLNPQDPTQDYYDPQEDEPEFRPNIIRVYLTDFSNTVRDAGSKEVETVLTDYLSTAVNWGKSKTLELSSAKAATYIMKNSGSWFEQVCGLTKTRRWFEKWIGRGCKVYLLVGLRTIFNGRIKIDHSTTTSTSGHAQLPADLLAGLPPMGLNIGGGGRISKDQGVTSEFSAAGERIWALQYRQIKFKWYSSRKIENAALETGARWLTFDRGGNKAYGGTVEAGIGAGVPVEIGTGIELGSKTGVEAGVDEDVIEAVMDDDLELGDQFDVQYANGEVLLIPN